MASTAQKLTPVTARDRLSKIIEAIAAVDDSSFYDLSNADDVSLLSTNTAFDSVEVSPETIFEKPDGKFEASAIVYVTLNYGSKRDRVSMPDSFPAIVQGSIDPSGRAAVEHIRVDTSSFYE